MDKNIKQLKKMQALSVNMRLAAQGWDKDYKTLIATMMSAQSRDETTIVIANNLFKKLPTLKSIANAKEEKILKIIKSLNYNKTKAKNINKCAKILFNDYGGKVPRYFEELVKLPGVGRKTANVFLSETGGVGIGVDTHVNYISHKLGWTTSKTQKDIENDLKKAFPKKYHSKLNEILVKFGKTYTSKKQKNKLLKEIKQIK